MAVGGICGSLLGGYALNNLNIETIFLLFTVLPALQLLSCPLVEEIPSNEPLPELLDSDEFEEKSKMSNDTYPHTKKSNTRRRKGQKKGKKGASSGKSETHKKQSKSLASKLFQSLKAAALELCRAFKQPIILR